MMTYREWLEDGASTSRVHLLPRSRWGSETFGDRIFILLPRWTREAVGYGTILRRMCEGLPDPG